MAAGAERRRLSLPGDRTRPANPVAAADRGRLDRYRSGGRRKIDSDDDVFVFRLDRESRPGRLRAAERGRHRRWQPRQRRGTPASVSFGDYLFGVIGLAARRGPDGDGRGPPAPAAAAGLGRRTRRGSPRRSSRVALLTVLLQLLGAFGILVPAVLIPAALLDRPRRATTGSGSTTESPKGRAHRPRRRSPFLRLVLALAAAAFVAAHWATGLQDVWARGMLTFDTLWYHGPFAARIADTGSVWGMHFTDPLYLNWFYPENSELLHGAGIVLFERDIFSPLVNFGWLGVAFLAAWCIGRPYGVAPLSLTAVAIAMDTGPMVPREAGTPATDTVPVAMLLAAAAILINAWAARDSATRRRPASGGGPRGRAARRGLGDRDRARIEADDLRGRGGDGRRRRRSSCPRERQLEGLLGLRRRSRRRGRVLVPPQPDPRRQPAALDQADRADRPARPEPGPGGPRRLHRRPLHLLQPEHRPLAAPTSSTRSRTCSARSGS